MTSSGNTTFSEASGMSLPDALNRYQALADRDSMARAIATLQARGEWNERPQPQRRRTTRR